MLLYLTALFVVVSVTGANDCPNPSWKFHEGSLTCTKIFTVAASWKKARETCQSNGGDLVTIRDAEINEFVRAQLDYRERYWIGMSANKDGLFTHVTGDLKVGFTNWRAREPNLKKQSEMCVEIIGNKRGRWKTKPCHKLRPYVCQTVPVKSVKTTMQKWNDLKVTWGNPKASNAADFFNSMPRTTKDAVDQGFQKVSDCDPKANWRGSRYIKDDDYALVLLYDVNGLIAGIQTTVPPQDTGYPFEPIQPPFVKDGDKFVLSAYFVDPKIICTTGRTAEEFERQGTGTKLFIQNGENAETDSIAIPLVETEIGATKWTKGKCMPTMGNHYWYDVSEDMSCQNFYPVFLLYNKGELNAFGWAMAANLSSKRLEHPPKKVFPMFFNPVPKCIHDYDALSTMHIYLTSNVFANKC